MPNVNLIVGPLQPFQCLDYTMLHISLQYFEIPTTRLENMTIFVKNHKLPKNSLFEIRPRLRNRSLESCKSKKVKLFLLIRLPYKVRK